MSSMYEFKALRQTNMHPKVRRFGRITLTILVIMFSMLFLPWQQTVEGEGKLVAFDPTQRDYELRSPHTGFISKYYVGENTAVKAGDPLCVISDQDPNYNERLQEKERLVQQQLLQTQNQRDSLKLEGAQLDKQYAAGLDVLKRRFDISQKKLQNLALKKDALVQDLKTKEEHYNRILALKSSGIESERDFQIIRNKKAQAQSLLEQNRVQMEMERQNLEILKTEKARFNAQQRALKEQNRQAIASVNAVLQTQQGALVDAKTRSSRYANRIIYADKNGTVMRIYNTDKNRLIIKGENLMHFVPDVSQRAVLLRISDFNMPLIQKNLPVRIRFHGWPTLQISGWPKIDFGTFGGHIHSFESMSHEKGAYYAYVLEDEAEPWPKEEVLRLGSQATVWVRLDTVPIWYQIWRTINAMPPNMPQEMP